MCGTTLSLWSLHWIAATGGDIYLCGGAQFAGTKFAGTMLCAGLIDRIVMKLKPALSGDGLRVAAHIRPTPLQLVDIERYVSGVALLTYDVKR